MKGNNKIIWNEYAPLCLKCEKEVDPDNYRHFYLDTNYPVYFHKECCPKTDKEFEQFGIRIMR